MGDVTYEYQKSILRILLIGYGAMILTGLSCVYGQVLSGYPSNLISLQKLLAK